MTKKYVILMIVVFSFSFLQMDCKKEPPVVPPDDPPPYKQSIFLSVTDSGLTEVYLTLSMTDTLPPRGFEIFRNNSKVLSGTLFGKDTTLVDMTAQLNTSYTYQAFRVDNAMRTDSSLVVATKTLDTTSHEFVWTIDTIGAIGSFHTDLFDVTIVNENEIWIGGRIYLSDTNVYNLVRWNSQSYNYDNLKYVYSPTYSAYTETHVLYNYGTNNLLAGAGVSVMHWNGTKWTNFPGLYISDNNFLGNTIGALWGTSLNNLYGVGLVGSIVRWNGSSWSRMPVNTTVDLKDIAGTPDGENMWACGGQPSTATPSTLLRYKNGMWQTIWEGDALPFRQDSISGRLMGVLVPNNSKALVLSRYGIYEISSATNKTIRRNSFVPKQFPGFPWAIRGNGENDFFVVGELNFIAHYNGSTWKHYAQFTNDNVILSSVAIKGDLVVAVGSIVDSFNGRGIILIGKRQN